VTNNNGEQMDKMKGVCIVFLVDKNVYELMYSENIVGYTDSFDEAVLVAWGPQLTQEIEEEIRQELAPYSEDTDNPLAGFKLDGARLALLVYEHKLIPAKAYSYLRLVVGNHRLANAIRMQMMGLDPVFEALHHVAEAIESGFDDLESALSGYEGYVSVGEAVKSVASSIDGLSASTRAIAHGDVTGPGGLEGLAMAVAGEGMESPLSNAVGYLSGAVETAAQDVADAIQRAFPKAKGGA